MIEIDIFSLESNHLDPEEKLAMAIVKDWFQTLLSVVIKARKRGRMTSEERKIWNLNIGWPYTKNARFWVEEVLGGSVQSLQNLAEDLTRLRKRQKPENFPVLEQIIENKSNHKHGKRIKNE